MKWSDGAPFTADDFIFWFEDIYSNPEIVPTPTPEMRPQGKPGRMVKVDETTVRWEFDVPYFLFEDIMAGDTAMGGGQAVRQAGKVSFGAYAPGHYLKQFLPKYSSVEAANARAKQEGFESWVQMLHFKKDWELNPDVPVLGPWRSVRPINNPIWLLERNPYYYAVDTAGNQLPYFDKVQFTLAENLEVINLRAMAGEYDEQERHIDLGKLPVLLDNQEKGNYKVHLDLGFAGSDFMFHVNQSFTGDPEVRKWLTNADFRRALALGIDRDQLNETFWLGVGTPGSPAPGETHAAKPRHRNGARSGRCSTWRRPMRCSTRSVWRRRTPMASGSAPTMANDCACRSSRSPRSCRIRSCPRWSPTSGARSASRPMCARWSAGWASPNRPTTNINCSSGTMAGPSCCTCSPPGRCPSCLVPGSGPAYAAWYASGGKQGTKPDDPNILKIFDLYTEAAGLKAEGRNQQRPGDLEDPGRSAVPASARSASPRRDLACAWCRTGWAISPPGSATRSIAARRATPIRRRGTSRHEAPRTATVIARSEATAIPRRTHGDCFAPLAMTAI